MPQILPVTSSDTAMPSPDDSDHVALLEALIDSRERWRQLSRTAFDVLFETDERGRLTMLVPIDRHDIASEQLLGQPADRLWSSGEQTSFDPRMVRKRFPVAAGIYLSVLPRFNQEGECQGAYAGLLYADPAPSAATAPIRENLPSALQRALAALRDETTPVNGAVAASESLCRDLGVDGGAVMLAQDVPGDVETMTDNMWQPLRQWGGTFMDTDKPLDNATNHPTCRAWRLDDKAFLWASARLRFGGGVGLLLRRTEDWSAAEKETATLLVGMMAGQLELDALHRRAIFDAPFDPASHLLTWHGFQQEIARRLPRLDREYMSATMIVICIQGLSDLLSDQNGLHAGDALNQVVSLVRNAVRPTDIVGRLNTECFLLWLDGGDRFAAAERAERMTTHGAPILLDTTHHLPVRIGLVTREPQSTDLLDDYLERATLALREAQGGDRKWVFSHEAP
ncbi:GGDEF domain-containing protein [Neoasaia chiangmaiensis]|nr:GGDEF domain-containing protein [Neoasaia chiangmaiensis]